MHTWWYSLKLFPCLLSLFGIVKQEDEHTKITLSQHLHYQKQCLHTLNYMASVEVSVILFHDQGS